VQCDVLIVGIDSDELILKLKGTYPVFDASTRAFMVNSLKCVSHSFIMDKPEDYMRVITTCENKPKLFKHSDRIHGEPIIGKQYAELVIVPDIVIPHSTTEIKEIIQKHHEKDSLARH
jgi:bifunctional ADP-heptose synthase (sugar kinase/adenylyltransferase)